MAIGRASALFAWSLLLASPLAAASPQPLVERVFLENINAVRAARHLPPLSLDPALSAFARRRVEEALAPGGSDVPLVGDALHARARESGYDARYLAELIVEAEGEDLAAIEAAWSEGNTGRPLVLRDDIHDLGVGIGRRGEIRGYVFLFGISAKGAFEERTKDLPADRATLVAGMIARVNQERRAFGRAPLRVNPRLDRAAQRHADDMLARSFYGHEDPEGRGPFQRALASGYRPLAVGENIARGEFSLTEVMDGWMNSEPHRRDLLEPSFVDVGFGFARGKNANGYQVIWVQLFGREK
jgi:uncharacterized protein YkwD